MNHGTLIQTGLSGFDSEEETLKQIKKILPFSIVLFRSDFNNVKELEELIKKINRVYEIDSGVRKPVIAVDQEGGNVVRLPWLDYIPSNYFLSKVDNVKLSYLSACITGTQLSEYGIKWNLAPVLDTLNKFNPVLLERSFGDDLEKIGNHGTAIIRGLNDSGVASTAKHFPGHGSVMEDSHEMLPTDARQRQLIYNDIYPFVRAIESGVRSVMLSHVLYSELDPDFPASMSQKIQKILREELGFKGVILTDSVNMKALSSNYELKEIVGQSVGKEADIIETSSLQTASEINQILSKMDINRMKDKVERNMNLVPERILKYNPPAEVVNSFSLIFNRTERVGSLDPNRPFILVFLDLKAETRVSESKNDGSQVVEKLKARELDFTILSLEQLVEKEIKNAQIVFIGRNEHMKTRYESINKVARGNSCVFISTSISGDLGLLDARMAYISCYSTKSENVLGAIYRAFQFF